MDNSPKRYYVGWDVGGWHCERNSRSRDALCILVEEDSEPHVKGKPWRGSLRKHLTGNRTQVTEAILECCCIEIESSSELIFAIDTSLGWPESFIHLVTNYKTDSVPCEGRYNPYLFRQTEMFLACNGFRPLSTVRDMIGSPSTKGMHFLSVVGLQPPQKVGVWENRRNQRTVTAIETYPAACRSSETLRSYFCRLSKDQAFTNSLTGGEHHDRDLEDALYCALVAWKFATHREQLPSPDGNVPVEEGWIWIP